MKALFQKVGEFFKNKYWLVKTRYQLAKDSGQLAQWKPGTKKGNMLLAGGVLGFSALAAVVFLVAKREAPTHFEPPVTLKNLPRPKIAPSQPVEVVTPNTPVQQPVARPLTPPPAKTANKAPAKAAPTQKAATKTATKSTTKPATKTAAKKPAAKSTARKPASSKTSKTTKKKTTKK